MMRLIRPPHYAGLRNPHTLSLVITHYSIIASASGHSSSSEPNYLRDFMRLAYKTAVKLAETAVHTSLTTIYCLPYEQQITR